MISICQNEILSRQAGIPAVASILCKFYPAITCETFHPGKAGWLFRTTQIWPYREKIFPGNHTSSPKLDEIVI